MGFLFLSCLQWPSQTPRSSFVPISITFALQVTAFCMKLFLNFVSVMSPARTTTKQVFSSTHLITSLLPSTIPSVYFCEFMSFRTASTVLFITASSTSCSGRAPLSLPDGARLLSQLKQTVALLKQTAAALPILLGPLLVPGY